MTTSLQTHVRTHEIALRFRRGELESVLQPGTHWKRVGRVDYVVDRLQVRFEDPLLEVLVEVPELRAELEVVELGDAERALLWRAGRLFAVLGPGLHAFWKSAGPFEVERFDTATLRFQHRALQRVLTHADAPKFLRAVRTHEHEVILVYRDGELVDRFGPGTYVHWLESGHVTWKSIDLRTQTLDVAGQEIMTADKVTLRINLVVRFRIADALRAVGAEVDASQGLYRAAQLALREAVGGRTLDALLGAKNEVSAELEAALASRAERLGLELEAVGLRDVILPGDMKELLNQVIEAQKQSEANLIRRREETAAARSQANTAKLLAENPVLLRMKELEQLGQVLAGARATLVLGQGDLVGQLRALGAGGDVGS